MMTHFFLYKNVLLLIHAYIPILFLFLFSVATSMSPSERLAYIVGAVLIYWSIIRITNKMSSNTQEIQDLVKCYSFAAIKHAEQRRMDPKKTPYINHPIGEKIFCNFSFPFIIHIVSFIFNFKNKNTCKDRDKYLKTLFLGAPFPYVRSSCENLNWIR